MSSTRPARDSDALRTTGRCAAEDQETRAVCGPIDENAQDVEELGHDLDLIEDDQAVERSQRKLGVLQTPKIGLRLEVEVGGPPALGERTRKGRLAGLSRTEKRGDWRPPRRLTELDEVGRAPDHG